ncbi:MAG TPA: 30S ribosomal protein S1 [Candidatus Latescibacteria bacterium]|nr:30S ribosomal protein S1 [Candidatus Latescibacterota bacterium]
MNEHQVGVRKGKKVGVFMDLEERGYSEEHFSEMLRLYDQTMEGIKQGEIVTGKVVAVSEKDVIVDIGFKSEGRIPASEFGDPPEVKVGDEVEVFIEEVEDQEGQIVLSKQRADFIQVWDQIKHAYDTGQTVEGYAVRRVKGGIMVDLLGVDAFLPGSQLDLKLVRNFDQFVGKTFPLKVIKVNKGRRNIVVSRRAVLAEEREKQRQALLAEIEEGQVCEGTVKNITDFGAFIDLGGVDGLLHITDMSWGRVSHPSELMAIGDKIKVKILNFDRERERVSLGLKQLTPHPWENIEEKYPIGAKVRGKVVNITNYGAFVQLEEGVEGLVHVSEMSWTQHIRHPSQMVAVGDTVEVVVLEIDKEQKKIALSLRQIEPDPWLTIDERYPVGSRVKGLVRSFTNFGAFIQIEDGIDGLLHISDMSWTKKVNHPSDILKKGSKVEVVILGIDKENRRISLGYKQLTEDPWDKLGVQFAPGTETEGKIKRIQDAGVVVELEGGVEGFVPASHLGQPALKKPAEGFQTGERLPLKVIQFEKEKKKIVLSVEEYLKDKEKAEIEEFKKKHMPKPVTIGDIVGEKESLGKREEMEEKPEHEGEEEEQEPGSEKLEEEQTSEHEESGDSEKSG